MLVQTGHALGQIPPLTTGGGGTGGITVQFASSSYTVNENAGNAVLTVTLSAAASDVVTVNYATSDGTAHAGTDYVAASGTVMFNAGVTSQNVSIGIIDNNNYSDQTVYFTVTLSNPSANVGLGSPSTTTVNIVDNDPPPTITINGVPAAQKNNPGGFVCVNANNDNGSTITYADGVTSVPSGTWGIPQKRDFNVSPMLKPDPDLIFLVLQTRECVTNRYGRP